MDPTNRRGTLTSCQGRQQSNNQRKHSAAGERSKKKIDVFRSQHGSYGYVAVCIAGGPVKLISRRCLREPAPSSVTHNPWPLRSRPSYSLFERYSSQISGTIDRQIERVVWDICNSREMLAFLSSTFCNDSQFFAPLSSPLTFTSGYNMYVSWLYYFSERAYFAHTGPLDSEPSSCRSHLLTIYRDHRWSVASARR